jgi:hypothetical protein
VQTRIVDADSRFRMPIAFGVRTVAYGGLSAVGPSRSSELECVSLSHRYPTGSQADGAAVGVAILVRTAGSAPLTGSLAVASL